MAVMETLPSSSASREFWLGVGWKAFIRYTVKSPPPVPRVPIMGISSDGSPLPFMSLSRQ